MGMKNSAQSFQKLAEHVLRGIPNVFIYLDDLLIYNDNHQDHLKTVEEVFKRLADNGLTIALSKCVFGVEELNYLGYTVNSAGIRPIERKIAAIQNFPTPTKQKQLLAFLGALNYYRASLPSLPPKPGGKERTPAEILDPLYQ